MPSPLAADPGERFADIGRAGGRNGGVPPVPQPRRGFFSTRGARATLNFCLIVTNILLALLVFRVELINYLGPGIASHLLGSPTRFTVTNLEPHSTLVENVEIVGGPSVGSIELRYDIRRLWRERVLTQVLIDGLDMSLSVDEAGDVLIPGFEFPAAKTDAGDASSVSPFIPIESVSLTDTSVRLNSPFGNDRIDLDLEAFFPEAPTIWPIRLDLTARAKDGGDQMALQISADAPPATGSSPVGRTGVVGNLTLSLPRWAPFLGLSGMESGRLAARIDMGVDPETLGLVDTTETADPSQILGALNGFADIEVQADVLQGFAPDIPPVRNLFGGISVEPDGYTLRVRSSGIRATADNPISQAIDGLANHLDDPDAVSGPIRLLVGEPGKPLDLTVRPTGIGFNISGQLGLTAETGPVAVSIGSLGQLNIGGPALHAELNDVSIATTPIALVPARLETTLLSDVVTVTLDETKTPNVKADFVLRLSGTGRAGGPINRVRFGLNSQGTVSYRPDSLSVRVSRGGKLRLRNLTALKVPNTTLPSNLSLALVGDGASFTLPLGEKDEPKGKIDFSAPAFSIALRDETGNDDAESKEIAFSPVTVSIEGNLSTASASIRTESITMPDLKLALKKVSLTGSRRGPRGSFVGRLGGIERAKLQLVNGETHVEMTIRQLGNGDFMADGIATLSDGRMVARFDGLFPGTVDNAPSLRIWSDPIVYSGGGLQPGDISTLFDGIARSVSGSLGLSTDMVLSPDGLAGEARVSFDDVGFQAQGLSISSLSSLIRVDLSKPPATVGSQDFSVQIDLPLFGTVPVTGRFTVADDLTIGISSIQASMLGGRIELRNGSLNPENNSLTGTLHIDDVSLASLTQLAAVDGVAGTGRISGKVPISVTPDGASIRSGALSAAGSGILRIDNPAVNQALAGQHEYVQLMIDALKDFRYDGLAIEANSEPNADGLLTLRLSGSNPAVLDNQKFNINVNLETDFNKLFAIFQAGLMVTDQLLERVRQVSDTQ